MNQNTSDPMAGTMKSAGRMPALFVGHGNPMNAIDETPFAETWRSLATQMPEPTHILCISAHWETAGTFVTAMDHPKTIHDFGGFPEELYRVEYPAPGDPRLAEEIRRIVKGATIQPDISWGLDHGCWSILRRMYPGANIPVVQLSIDYRQPPRFHYELARELQPLRDRGVLIVGSGNLVHNLRKVDWHHPDRAHDWAVAATEAMKSMIAGHDTEGLIRYPGSTPEAQLAIPTLEHYLPLLYVMGVASPGEQVSFFNDTVMMGAVGMTGTGVGMTIYD